MASEVPNPSLSPSRASRRQRVVTGATNRSKTPQTTQFPTINSPSRDNRESKSSNLHHRPHTSTGFAANEPISRLSQRSHSRQDLRSPKWNNAQSRLSSSHSVHSHRLTAAQEAMLKKKEDEARLDRLSGSIQNIAHLFYPNLREMFRKFDADKDGSITFEEMAYCFERQPFNCVDRDQIRLLFNAVDKNGDGRVEFSEFVTMFNPREELATKITENENKENKSMTHSERVKARLRFEKALKGLKEKILQHQKISKVLYKQDGIFLLGAFRHFDRDSNGLLSFDEFKQAIGSENLNLGISDEDAWDLMKYMDRDGCGAVSYAEFLRALAKVDSEDTYDPFKQSRSRELHRLGDITSTNSIHIGSKLSRPSTTQSSQSFHEPRPNSNASSMSNENSSYHTSSFSELKALRNHDCDDVHGARRRPDPRIPFSKYSFTPPQVNTTERLGFSCSSSSPQFISDSERFLSTNKQQFQTVPVHLQHEFRGSTLSSFSRSCDLKLTDKSVKSINELDRESSLSKQAARLERIRRNHSLISESIAREEEAKKFAEERRLRTKSGQRLRYLHALEQQEKDRIVL